MSKTDELELDAEQQDNMQNQISEILCDYSWCFEEVWKMGFIAGREFKEEE